MHLYAFGSVVRGEISQDSDIDLLAIVEGYDPRFDPDVFSIYSYARLEELWAEGNPFAWHLALESKLLYAADSSDFLKMLGTPRKYSAGLQDCGKFYDLFKTASAELLSASSSPVFNLSTVFLSLRNFASCFLLEFGSHPDFSRHAALRLGAEDIPICHKAYTILERARILSTRGRGPNLTAPEITAAVAELEKIDGWMQTLLRKAIDHARIQQ